MVDTSGNQIGAGSIASEKALLTPFWEAFSNIPIGLLVIGQDSTVHFANSRAGFFLGVHPSSALIGKPIRGTLVETPVLEVLATGLPLYDKEEVFENCHLKLSHIPLKIGGTIIGCLVIMLDQTDTLPIVNALSEVKERCETLELLLEDTFEEIVIADRAHRIIYISPKLTQNSRISRDEILGGDISLIDPESLLKKTLETGMPHGTDVKASSPIFKANQMVGAALRNRINEFVRSKPIARGYEVQRPCLPPRQIGGSRFSLDNIIGESEAIKYAKKRALRVAEGDSTVLITGESGTGKEVFAQAIHSASLRRGGPFVRVNCAGIPEPLLESELFGYEPGSFTGANKRGKKGKFELAHNGTLFLDEAADMSMAMQAKVLRAIQENEFERVGGTITYEVDVRIIAATNKDLWKMVDEGMFREDLYYRLDVININIPPLRERLEDIPLLVNAFIPDLANRCRSPVTTVANEALECLISYNWPGNIRELINVLEEAVSLTTETHVHVEALPLKVRKNRPSSLGKILLTENSFTSPRLAAVEKAMIEEALAKKAGNKRQAAISLRMPRSTFYEKLKKYKISA